MAIALNLMVLFSCKKADQIQPLDQLQLVNNQEFRRYVANDILNRLSFTFYASQRINKTQHQFLKNELLNKSDDQISSILFKYNLSFIFFQQSLLKQVYSKSRLFNQIHSLNQLTELESDQLIEKHYKIVSNDIMYKVKAVLKKEISPKSQKLHQKSGINTLSSNHEMVYFTEEYDTFFQEDLSEEDAIASIAQEILDQGMISSNGLSVDEIWNCARSAVGLGSGFVLGIAGLKELAKKDIHSAVIATSKWLAKRAGWVGAIIIGLDFSSCVYGKSND